MGLHRCSSPSSTSSGWWRCGSLCVYARSLFGIIDLLAILPTYLSVLVPGAQSLLVVRLLRLLRIFRVLKLAEYLRESKVLAQAMRASGRKIAVFLLVVVTIVVIVGSLMYVIEGEEHGFTSIPISIYWAIVTLTTVGYGDLAPATTLGRALAVVLMLTGYGIIAVPTGIVTVELTRANAQPVSSQACPGCGLGSARFRRGVLPALWSEALVRYLAPFLALQNETHRDISSPDPLDGLVHSCERHDFDDGRDAMLRRELEHLRRVRTAPDVVPIDRSPRIVQ